MQSAPLVSITMASDDSILSSIADTRVLVVGDIMLDRYWFGDVDRISPEAPVPVVSVNRSEARMGGAGNVALNINSLGGRCTLVGIAGDDGAGVELESIAKQADIPTNLIVDAEMPTSIKQRVISRNQQLIRADFEGVPAAASIEQLASITAGLLNQHDVLILSDYGKGALRQVENLIEMAVERKMPVMVDPKGVDFSRYAGASLITPNLKELENAVGQISDDDDLAAKSSSVLTRYHLGGLLVTLSERGMKLFEQGKSPLHSPARAREVYDVSGAGDTVIAIMAMCKGAAVSSADSLRIANSAAGVVVSKLGTASATMTELSEAMKRDMKQ